MAARALVTGAAGFIGSHLAETLLGQGASVVGIDRVSSYYNPDTKRRNLDLLRTFPNFEFVEGNLSALPLFEYVSEVDVVFHLAAQPGVRTSWADFDTYVADNILATKHLLDACTEASVQRLVYASSSSVYGNSTAFPCYESFPTTPESPYGVTKLAAEHLCVAYANNFKLPTVALRYFTVYGPRQRPDMALEAMFLAIESGAPFRVLGDGAQVRDFTYVGDIVSANLAAAVSDVPPGSVFNISGGSSASLNEIIAIVESVTGRPLLQDRQPASAGDVTRTGGSSELARDLLRWEPATDLLSGISAQAMWHGLG